MRVTIRPYRRGGWEADIRVVTPDGARQIRERKRAPLTSRSADVRWAEGRERILFQRLMDPPQQPAPQKEVPTLQEFTPRFLDGHARANRQKPSTVAAKEMILRVHLVPVLGHRKLDAIRTEDIQRLKSGLTTKAVKTVNNILTVLNVLLKRAVEWEVIERMPCTITLLRVSRSSTHFYDFDEFERLVAAARATDARAFTCAHGRRSGLRLGEMVALEWSDIDFVKRQCASSDRRGKGTSHHPKVAGSATSRLPRDSRRRFATTVTCAAR
jgi:integrase